MSTASNCTISARRSDGSIDLAALADVLHVTQAELAASLERPAESDAGVSGQSSPETQHRLSVLVELLERVTPWAGDPQSAYQWFCDQPIAGFGGETAQQLVKAGRASAVEAYLNRIADGGYA